MTSVKQLEALGRERLSPNFFMRDFLYSEVSQVERIPNVPADPQLALKSGRGLCSNVLEPIQAALGKISIRSAYRSPEVNRVGNEKKYNCASNERNAARHIWDAPDAHRHFGATACIVVNSFVDYYEETGDWPALAWWIHDHVPAYRDMMFYPQLAAFNINWYSGPVEEQTVASQMTNPENGRKGILFKARVTDARVARREKYSAWLG